MFNEVMVDVETTGTDPSHSCIIQIAAVRFNLEEKTIDTEEMFDRCLYDTVSNRFWDDSTRVWWQRQKSEVLDDILLRSEPPERVMRDFEMFLAQTPADEPLRFWAKPISFDFPLVSSYFKQFGLNIPCHYRHAKDVNTYIWSRGHRDIDDFWSAQEFHGDRHNALFDVIHQIQGLFNA